MAGEHALTPQMEELMRRMGREVPSQARSLELNPKHPLVQRLQALHGAGQGEVVAQSIAVLRDAALVAEGARVADAATFAKRVQEMLLQTVPPAAKAAG